MTAVTDTKVGVGGFNNLGKVGNITVTNASTDALAFGINGATVNAGSAGSIGNVSVTAAGGTAINNLTLNANITSASGGDTVLNSTIGTVTVTGANAGIANLSATALGSIAATGTGISSSGTGSQVVSLTAPAVGALSFNSMAAAGNTATVNFTGTTTVGPITVNQSFIYTGAGSILNMGAVSIGASAGVAGTITGGNFGAAAGATVAANANLVINATGGGGVNFRIDNTPSYTGSVTGLAPAVIKPGGVQASGAFGPVAGVTVTLI